MSVRVQVILDPAERERFRRAAAADGVSLSAWMKRAAEERYADSTGAGGIESVGELRAFFAACDERETGDESDWAEHRGVIERSQASGVAES